MLSNQEIDMKRIYYYVAILVSCLFAFTACETDEEATGKAKGTLVLGLEVAPIPDVAVTKANVEVNDFILKIEKKEGTPVFEETYTYSELKKVGTLSLDPGNYTIGATQSEGGMLDVSDSPYFEGNQNFTISNGEPSVVVVKCQMQNAKIKIDLSAVYSSFQPNTLKARIEKTDDNTVRYNFSINNEGLSNDSYIHPSKRWKLVIEGTTVDGFEMGSLGVIPLELFKANTYSILTVKIAQGSDTKANDAYTSGKPVFQLKVTTAE